MQTVLRTLVLMRVLGKKPTPLVREVQMGMKPFGAPSGGQQPFLPGPQGRFGAGSAVSGQQQQQQTPIFTGKQQSGFEVIADSNPFSDSRLWGDSDNI